MDEARPVYVVKILNHRAQHIQQLVEVIFRSFLFQALLHSLAVDEFHDYICRGVRVEEVLYMHYTALAAEARHCPCLIQELFPLPFEQYFSLCARRLDRLGVLGIPCHRARRIEFLDGHSLFKPQVKPYICNTEAALTQHLAYEIASLQYRHHRQLVLPVLRAHIPAADAALFRAVRVLRHARWAVFRHLFLLRVFCIFVFIDIISILYTYSSCKLIHINFDKKYRGKSAPIP